MGERRWSRGQGFFAEALAKKGNLIAYVGDVVGSSRTTNSVLWFTGEDILRPEQAFRQLRFQGVDRSKKPLPETVGAFFGLM